MVKRKQYGISDDLVKSLENAVYEAENYAGQMRFEILPIVII